MVAIGIVIGQMLRVSACPVVVAFTYVGPVPGDTPARPALVARALAAEVGARS